MIQNKTILFSTLQTLLFGFIVFIFWSNIYPAHLYFHEQFQLFNYSTHYFIETITLPGGISHYISRFVVQFYYDSFWGPFFLTLFIIIFQLLFVYLLHRVPSKNNKEINYTITFLPSIAIWAFLLCIDAMPYFLIASIFNLLFVSIAISIKSILPRVIYEIISVAILFIITGGLFFLFICLIACLEIIESHKNREGVSSFFILLIAATSWFGVLAIGTQVYNYSYISLLNCIGTYRYPTMDFPQKYIAIFTIIGVGLYILSGISNKFNIRKLYSYISIFCIISVIFFYIYSLTDEQEESVLHYDYLTRTRHWDIILKTASHIKPSTNWEQICLNLALAQKGILCDRLFEFPQKGRESLLASYEQDYMSPQFSGEAYLSIGLINTAQRYFFEAMEAIPDYQKSGRCYQRLAITNLINGKYEVAELYLKKLSRSHYYKKWADNMSLFLYNDTLIENDKEMGGLRKGLFKNNFFMDECKLEPFLLILLNDYPDNAIGWQYLFALCLIDKNLNQLEHAVELYLTTNKDATLPIHVQEALLMQWLQSNDSLDELPWQIDNLVKERLMLFVNALNQSPATKEKVARKHFNNTFWRYALFG